MKVKALSILILMTAVIIVPVVLAPAGQISGPGTADGSQGTNFWYRDNKWTKKGQFWANRGHLKLKPGRTYVFTWIGIDDSLIVGNPTKEAWHVFILDAGEGSHGWEHIALQTRKDESWYKDQGKKIIRFLVNWGGPGGQALVSADAILDLRLVLRQNTGDDKWHIEAWYDDGSGWTKFVDYDDVDISTDWSGLPGYLTQACAGIQIDAQSDGTLYFHPASPLSHSK